jgi:hypothetical protein
VPSILVDEDAGRGDVHIASMQVARDGEAQAMAPVLRARDTAVR